MLISIQVYRVLSLSLLVLLTVGYSVSLCAELSKIRLEEGRLVNNAGEPVTLRGCNVGNWLILEMWMLDQADDEIDDQHKLEELFAERFGDDGRHRLMELFRENWVGPRDFDIIKSFGFNVIRLPFEYRLLEAEPFKLRDDAWKWLDYTIDQAERRGIYVILDMHGAPGRQSAMDHTGRREHNRLWGDEEAQERTVWLWKKIAERYRDRDAVCAYDVLNEPWGGKHEQLADLVERIRQAVREVDPDKVFILPGFYYGIDFYGDPDEQGWDQSIFTMHFYPGFFGWGRARPRTHGEFLLEGMTEWTERMERLQRPLLIGEFNVVLKKAGGGEMMRRYYDRYAELGWPATMWSYKVLGRNGGVGGGVWGMVTNAEPFAPIDWREASYEELEAYMRSHAAMAYEIDEDLRHWMTTDQTPRPVQEVMGPEPVKVTEPAAVDELPAGWSALDINGALAGGQSVEGPGRITVYGGGEDIWWDSDQFRLVYRQVTGDFTLEARVKSLTDTHQYAKAGLIVRDSLEPGSRFVMLNVFPDGVSELGVRHAAGEDASGVRPGALDLPDAWLKLERRDGVIRAYIASEPGLWREVEDPELPTLDDTVHVGLVALSHDNTQLAAAAYEQVRLSQP